MKVIAGTVLVLSLTVPVDAADWWRFAMRASTLSAGVAHAADTATTMYCRGQGICRESNPWLLRYDRPIPFAVAKTTLAGGTLWATAVLFDHCESVGCKAAAVGANVGQTIAFGWVARHNSRVGQ